METEFKALLDKDFDASKEIEKNVMDVFMAEDWTNYPIGKRGAVQNLLIQNMT
jgi:2-oxoglutarate dehydrogenase E1 component